MGPSSLLQVIDRLRRALSTQPTLPASRVPALFREPGVETGYRPPGKAWSYYLLSAFQLNNETVNIWTHFLAVFVLVHRFFVADTIDGNPNTWPFVAYSLASVTCVLMSSVAHTFHSKSPYAHYFCFELDYMGIGLGNISANTLLLYTCSPVWLYDIIQPYFFIVNVVIGAVFMIGCTLSKVKYRRPYPPRRKAIQLVTGAVSVSPSLAILCTKLGTCLSDDTCPVTSLGHHGRWVSSLVLCLFFFSSHLPEKLYPGKFDVIGQGHQVFHVFQALSRVLQFEAGHIDVLDNELSHSNLSDSSMLWQQFAMFSAYLVCCMAVMVILNPTVVRRVQEDKKLSS